MLEPALTQFVELARLDAELTKLRLRYLHAGLRGDAAPTWGPQAEAETHRVVEQVRAFYQGDDWKGRFLPTPDEPDQVVKQILQGSRETARQSLVLLHQLVMETPVVGCPEGDEPAR